MYFKNIPPGRDSTVFTYINHLWVVRDMEGACVELFVIENYSDQDESFAAVIESYDLASTQKPASPAPVISIGGVKSDVKDDVMEVDIPDTADLENEISSIDEQILLLNQQIKDFPEENKNIEDPEWDNRLITLIDLSLIHI